MTGSANVSCTTPARRRRPLPAAAASVTPSRPLSHLLLTGRPAPPRAARPPVSPRSAGDLAAAPAGWQTTGLHGRATVTRPGRPPDGSAGWRGLRSPYPGDSGRNHELPMLGSKLFSPEWCVKPGWAAGPPDTDGPAACRPGRRRRRGYSRRTVTQLIRRAGRTGAAHAPDHHPSGHRR